MSELLDSYRLSNGLATPWLEGDRGLSYGDGLFETMLSRAGKVQELALHQARLEQGCARLGLDMPANFAAEAEALAARHAEHDWAMIKFIGSRRAGQRGYAPTSRAVQQHWQISAMSCPVDSSWDTGLRMRLGQERLVRNAALAGIKHCNRLEHVLAAKSAAGRETLLLDTQGCVVESLTANIFVHVDGGWLTPRLKYCGVEGTQRAWLIAEANAEERDLYLSDIYRAEELLLCNSLRGIRPITAIGCHEKNIGEHTRALQAALRKKWQC